MPQTSNFPVITHLICGCYGNQWLHIPLGSHIDPVQPSVTLHNTTQPYVTLCNPAETLCDPP